MMPYVDGSVEPYNARIWSYAIISLGPDNIELHKEVKELVQSHQGT